VRGEDDLLVIEVSGDDGIADTCVGFLKGFLLIYRCPTPWRYFLEPSGFFACEELPALAFFCAFFF
jgi:hypothetical protein